MRYEIFRNPRRDGVIYVDSRGYPGDNLGCRIGKNLGVESEDHLIFKLKNSEMVLFLDNVEQNFHSELFEKKNIVYEFLKKLIEDTKGIQIVSTSANNFPGFALKCEIEISNFSKGDAYELLVK